MRLHIKGKYSLQDARQGIFGTKTERGGKLLINPGPGDKRQFQ